MKKAQFRDHVRDYVKSQTGDNIGDFKDAQKSRWMTRFFVSEVLSRLYPGLIPEDEEELGRCLVDGKGDGGVDFICRRDNQVLIIQAKYRASDRLEPSEEFEEFCNVLARLESAREEKGKFSRYMKQALEDIDWERDNFLLYFITLGHGNEKIESRERQGVNKTRSLRDLDERCELHFCDESKLNEIFREALTYDTALHGEVEVLFSQMKGQPSWIRYEDGEHKCYVGRIKASQITELFKKYKHRLFTLNIRNYVGDTSTNKTIKETAWTEPGNFFFFNNGLAAVSTNIIECPDKPQLLCSDFSIINGAQTVRSLTKACQCDDEGRRTEARSAEVLLRVTEVSLRTKQRDQSFLDNVTRFNNTQNQVKTSDFRSNDPVQRSLRTHFEKVSRGGKSYYYRNKREETKQNVYTIKLEDFARTIHAFRRGPVDMFGGLSYLFDTSQRGGYIIVFGDGEQCFDHLDAQSFGMLAGTWFLCEAIKETYPEIRAGIATREAEVSSETQSDAPGLGDAITKWLTIFSFSQILERIYRDAQKDLLSDIRHLAKPNWLDERGATWRSIERITAEACDVIRVVYAARQNREKFTIRQWARDDSTLQQIRREVLLRPGIQALTTLR